MTFCPLRTDAPTSKAALACGAWHVDVGSSPPRRACRSPASTCARPTPRRSCSTSAAAPAGRPPPARRAAATGTRPPV